MFMLNYKFSIIFYRIFSRAYFYLPIFVVYLFANGMNIFGICQVVSIYCVSLLLGSEALKVLKPRLCSKYMLMLSEMTKLIGLILFIFLKVKWVCVTQILLGVGYAIGAGYDSKLIYSKIKNPEIFQARSNSCMFYSVLISGIIGFFAFRENTLYPFYLTAFSSLLLIIFLILFVPAESYETSDLTTVHSVKKDVKQYEKYEYVVMYCFIRGIILAIFTAFLPYHLYIDLKINTVNFIGILSSYTILGFISSKYLAKHFSSKITEANILLLIAVILLFVDRIEILYMSVGLLGIVSGMTRPVCMNNLKRLSVDIPTISPVLERNYSIVNVCFTIIGGFLYLNNGFICVVYLTLILLFIYYSLFYFFKLKA